MSNFERIEQKSPKSESCFSKKGVGHRFYQIVFDKSKNRSSSGETMYSTEWTLFRNFVSRFYVCCTKETVWVKSLFNNYSCPIFTSFPNRHPSLLTCCMTISWTRMWSGRFSITDYLNEEFLWRLSILLVPRTIHYFISSTREFIRERQHFRGLLIWTTYRL